MGLGAAGDEIGDLCGDSLGLGVVVLVGAVSDVRSPSRWLDRRTVPSRWVARARTSLAKVTICGVER